MINIIKYIIPIVIFKSSLSIAVHAHIIIIYCICVYLIKLKTLKLYNSVIINESIYNIGTHVL